MAIQYTQTLISLKRLVEKQSNESLAKIIKQENDNAGALILALSSQKIDQKFSVNLSSRSKLPYSNL